MCILLRNCLLLLSILNALVLVKQRVSLSWWKVLSLESCLTYTDSSPPPTEGSNLELRPFPLKKLLYYVRVLLLLVGKRRLDLWETELQTSAFVEVRAR